MSPSPLALPAAWLALAGALSLLVSCGGAAPAFQPPAGGPAARLSACKARLGHAPGDEEAQRCARRAARTLGQSEAFAAWLAQRPAPPAALARAQLDSDPSRAAETARACTSAPACQLVLGLAEARRRASASPKTS